MKSYRQNLIKKERLYYLCDTRTVTGNCLMFWRKEAKGYSCDLNQAEVYTGKEAMARHKFRETDVPMPKDLLDSLAKRHIDHQDIDRIISEQLERTENGTVEIRCAAACTLQHGGICELKKPCDRYRPFNLHECVKVEEAK